MLLERESGTPVAAAAAARDAVRDAIERASAVATAVESRMCLAFVSTLPLGEER